MAALPFNGGAQQNYQKALADLVVDGQRVGAIQFLLGGNGDMLLSTFDLKPSLGGLLKTTIGATLFEKDRLVTVAELEIYGIHATLDTSNLILSIVVSPESMRPELVEARESADIGPGEEQFPNADFAATVGTSFELDPSWQAGPIGQSSWTSRLTLSPAVDMAGLVAEADGSLANSPFGYSTSVDEARLLKDFPALGSRLQAGIVTEPAVSFQSARQIYGIAFGREAGLPGWPATPTVTAGEFVVHENAEVRVYINGNFTRQLDLAPGTYHLSDLPLASGLNEVRVEIDEKGSPPREVSLGIPYDQSVIGAGTIDYSIALGTSQDDPTVPFGFGHVAFGFGDVFQLGADAEVGYSAGLMGLSAIAATKAGTFGLSAGLSSDLAAAFSPAFALRSFWRFSSFVDERLPRLGAAVEYHSPGFTAPGTIAVAENDYWDFSGQTGIPIPGGIGMLSLSGDADYVGGSLDGWTFTAGPSFSPTDSTLISVSGGYDWRSESGGQPRLSISLSVQPPDRRGVTYQRDFMSGTDAVGLNFGFGDSGTLSFTGQNLAGAGQYREVDVAGSDGISAAAFSASGSFGQNSDTGLDGGQLSLGVSTALAFAGGAFAMTQSAGSALAIVVPAAVLGGQAVEIRPVDGAPIQSPKGRPTAIDDLTPYTEYAAGIELPDSPPDVRPDPPSVKFMPEYRSITVIKVGRASSATIRGFLVDAKGAPKTNLAGDLFDASGKAVDQGATFTDDKGIFECFGLPKGRLTIKWDDGSTCSVDVPEGAPGAISDIGTVVAEQAAGGKEGGKS